jgi:beta-lactamase class D
LRRLYNYELPFRREDVDVLKDIMQVETNAEYSLYAKSGWATTTPPVGWYVGFVETSAGTWLFAMNMQVDNRAQVGLRKKLTIASLQALGII